LGNFFDKGGFSEAMPRKLFTDLLEFHPLFDGTEG
jgi:hypothetical protein